jgi:hypothetical protein
MITKHEKHYELNAEWVKFTRHILRSAVVEALEEGEMPQNMPYLMSTLQHLANLEDGKNAMLCDKLELNCLVAAVQWRIEHCINVYNKMFDSKEPIVRVDGVYSKDFPYMLDRDKYGLLVCGRWWYNEYTMYLMKILRDELARELIPSFV